MAKPKCYTPQLSREIVSRLYFKAKAECVPMTVLANRIMENALGKPEAITPNAAEKRKTTNAGLKVRRETKARLLPGFSSTTKQKEQIYGANNAVF